jgi:hypothetical protein
LVKLQLHVASGVRPLPDALSVRQSRSGLFPAQGGSLGARPMESDTYGLIWSSASEGACLPDFSSVAPIWRLIWSFACVTTTRPSTAKKPAPAGSNSSCAMSQGRVLRGGRSRGGSGRSCSRRR